MQAAFERLFQKMYLALNCFFFQSFKSTLRHSLLKPFCEAFVFYSYFHLVLSFSLKNNEELIFMYLLNSKKVDAKLKDSHQHSRNQWLPKHSYCLHFSMLITRLISLPKKLKFIT